MSELRRLSARQLAAGVAIIALALVWPLVSGELVARMGVRTLASTLLIVSAASFLAVRASLPPALALARSDALALLGLVAAAAISDARVFLLLVPAWVQVALFRIFRRSVRSGTSVFEHVAFAIEPHAPDFIRPYCRGATVLWAGLFLANAVAIAALALAAPLEWWRAFTGWIVWLAMAGCAAADFAVRKIYFRAYGDGPIDRLLARWFPSERTEMGRRSNAYKREMRLSLGRPP